MYIYIYQYISTHTHTSLSLSIYIYYIDIHILIYDITLFGWDDSHPDLPTSSGSKYLERLGGRDGARPGEELYLHCPRRVAGARGAPGWGGWGQKGRGLKTVGVV